MGQLVQPEGIARIRLEMRDEGRRTVDAVPRGKLVVKDRHEMQPVLCIHDVSLRGISLCVDHALVPGEPVVIELERGDVALSFYAYVAWCHPDPSDDAAGRHMAGLRVYGAQSLGPLLAH